MLFFLAAALFAAIPFSTSTILTSLLIFSGVVILFAHIRMWLNSEFSIISSNQKKIYEKLKNR